METTISPEIQSDTTLAPAVRQADQVLRRLMARVDQPPMATWRPGSVKHSSGLPTAELELLDDADFIAQNFTVDQMSDPRALRTALSALWGELIMQAYGKSTERLLAALRDIRKEEESRELELQGA